MTFNTSPSLSIGVELELQIIKARELDLSRDAQDLLARLQRIEVPGAVKPEITQSMIELNTSVHQHYDTLLAELQQMRDIVAREALRLNLLIAGGGTHPFHRWSERRIFPDERFNQVAQRYGFMAKQFTVFGQHIHIGCPDGDAAIYLTHAFTRYLPHFIALAAASPYYQGEDTLFQSSRLAVVDAFPLSGHMPIVSTWGEFIEYFDNMVKLGIVASMKDFYWDIRPKPEFGTIEIRVCDTPLTVERAALLAGYAQTLAHYLLALRPPAPVPATYQVNRFNRFEACRFGLDAQLVDAQSSERRSLRDDLASTILLLKDHAATLGTEAVLSEIDGLLRGAIAQSELLRQRYQQRQALHDVVRAQTDYWMAVSPQKSDDEKADKNYSP
jgi:glutamate---cysteine ligase / carboxylate-amine ligase